MQGWVWATWAFSHESIEAKSFRSFHQIDERMDQIHLRGLVLTEENQNKCCKRLDSHSRPCGRLTKVHQSCWSVSSDERTLTSRSFDSPPSSSTVDDAAPHVCTNKQEVTTTSWIFQISIPRQLRSKLFVLLRETNVIRLHPGAFIPPYPILRDPSSTPPPPKDDVSLLQ